MCVYHFLQKKRSIRTGSSCFSDGRGAEVAFLPALDTSSFGGWQRNNSDPFFGSSFCVLYAFVSCVLHNIVLVAVVVGLGCGNRFAGVCGLFCFNQRNSSSSFDRFVLGFNHQVVVNPHVEHVFGSHVPLLGVMCFAFCNMHISTCPLPTLLGLLSRRILQGIWLIARVFLFLREVLLILHPFGCVFLVECVSTQFRAFCGTFFTHVDQKLEYKNWPAAGEIFSLFERTLNTKSESLVKSFRPPNSTQKHRLHNKMVRNGAILSLIQCHKVC